MDQQDTQALSTCPVCGVSIAADGRVNFTVGQPGTRAKLYARVCTFNQQPGCINQQPELIGDIAPEDGFQSVEDLNLTDIHYSVN
ncbi:MAG: hypothetical protein ACFCU8_04740 [Thermosynechococcaceae cyanobacterium]